MNVAAQLASTGRTVLIVDFDLEAPGLHTFNLPKPKRGQLGLVDYVSEYLHSGKAPEDMTRFVYQCPTQSPLFETEQGSLWVMLAGHLGEGYANRFNQIDWRDLYSRHNGYLLFENLKSQWKEFNKPDYVLIDSRTGHTDVGGICTRQLPHAVVALFFPNEQNLLGLQQIVNDIRAEATSQRKKDIAIPFVMSNVPDLDDVNQILSTRVKQFEEVLGYDITNLVVNHYPSLDLLNQEIFAVSKPNTRLAKQYRELTRAVIAENEEDREGAIEILKEIRRGIRSRRAVTSVKEIDGLNKRLERIKGLHHDDGELLMLAAEVRARQGDISEASVLLDSAETHGVEGSEFWLRQAEYRAALGEKERASDAIERVLQSDDATELDIAKAASLLTKVLPERLPEILDTRAVRALDSEFKVWLASRLYDSPHGMLAAYNLVEGVLRETSLSRDIRIAARGKIILIAISLGRFEEAIERAKEVSSESEDVCVHIGFNYAMADWGRNGVPNKALFEEVLRLHNEEEDREEDPNDLQCIALAAWATGDCESAKELLMKSRKEITTKPRSEFSCWRYYQVSLRVFLEDLDEMTRLFNGERLLPRFMRER